MDMRKRFQVIDHTADIGIKAFGETTDELFRNAAIGMFSLIMKDMKNQYPDQGREIYQIKCEAECMEDLLITWLSELLYLHHVHFVILTQFKILFLSNHLIQAETAGYCIKGFGDTINLEIKAVTYCGIQIQKNEKGQWEAQIIFDV